MDKKLEHLFYAVLGGALAMKEKLDASSDEPRPTWPAVCRMNSERMMPYTALFEPFEIKSLIIPNRILMSAMGNNLSDAEGLPTPLAMAYYLARARGGVGMIVTEAVPVDHHRHGDVQRRESLVSQLQVVVAEGCRFGDQDNDVGVHDGIDGRA